ncbi:2,3-diaminopropionate biosynthesis protein SbnB [Bacillus atrophaeus]|jgi:ornithine cyclodeaminase|uniref:2,3-diaminopropionate biosynthesis protein SbnB n=2 Tax=Bacillus atrophaeus TaxID=1452 RepID=UPI002282D7B7|nr:2,3-diaminopropionate biosynthesis protein SbnB [Bacillus atrophaeus]MCY8487028.1 2,3-diaminopropionate biosynthesis protein SbnB [Bacillus atrophaeus]MCY8490938.1 2,3-diaminopropionate biosynthesis protein SbnB [Bacillus atrophaeus]
MRYLSETDCKSIPINWDSTILVIEKAVKCMYKGDYSQPIKPYLKYRNPVNRIIAMPAFIGGTADIAGIKWIASFPSNHEVDLPRAHSTIILNDSYTGQPVSILNGAYLSIIRTASVSGLFIKKYLEARKGLTNLKLGIVGFGPIGQYHLKMCSHILGSKLEKVYLYDKKKVSVHSLKELSEQCEVIVTDKWEKAYENADIFITCTVAKERYINKRPQQGSLLLNVSLRDYCIDSVLLEEDIIVVDDWNEVARADTDIQRMKDMKGLTQEDCFLLKDVICEESLKYIPPKSTVMFNPMGMSVFDVAIGNYYYRESIKKGLGLLLD